MGTVAQEGLTAQPAGSPHRPPLEGCGGCCRVRVECGQNWIPRAVQISQWDREVQTPLQGAVKQGGPPACLGSESFGVVGSVGDCSRWLGGGPQGGEGTGGVCVERRKQTVWTCRVQELSRRGWEGPPADHLYA